MNQSVAYLKLYHPEDTPALGEINKDEIMRYAGMFKAGMKEQLPEDMEAMLRIMEECLKEVLPLLTYKVSYRRDPMCVSEDDNGQTLLQLPFDCHGSRDLEKNLRGCSEMVMFAATIGIGIDRLIARYNRTSPVKALFLQAIGAERIETLCDIFQEEIREEVEREGLCIHPRYSPGYGDLPLLVQTDFMRLLDCSRRIGVTLNESLLMSPSKSVTAIIGIGSEQMAGTTHKCAQCGKTDCQYRG